MKQSLKSLFLELFSSKLYAAILMLIFILPLSFGESNTSESFMPLAGSGIIQRESPSFNFSTLTLSVSPRYEFPLLTSTQYFTNGLSAGFSIAYKPPVTFPIYFSLDFGYTYLPLNLDWANPIHTAIIGAGMGLDFKFLGRLSGNLYLKGGYYETIFKDIDGNTLYGGNPYIDTGASLGFYFSSRLRIAIGTSYRQLFGKPENLFKGIGLYVETSYRFPLNDTVDIEPVRTKPSKLEITKLRINNIFPVFYKYYDDHPIGKLTLVNKERGKIDNIRVSFFIKQYMDNPKNYKIEGTIDRGKSKAIDIFALFNEKVLEITEGTKVSSKLTVEYEIKGIEKTKSIISTISIQNRNASIWDDDRRATAFITARDPVVLRLSKNLAGIIREESNKVFGKNFMLLNAIHNSLSTYGITYVVDPKTPYRDFHKKREAIDFLQFPRQTLEYKAGDCDDLSILYSALLEALSIDTALITVPGHIYIAVDLGISPKKARAIFYNYNELIIRNNRVWLPFEVTMVQDDFMDAWKEGALEWKRYSMVETAKNPMGDSSTDSTKTSTTRSQKDSAHGVGFYPVSEAWRVFEPVGLPNSAGGINEIKLPSMEKVATLFKRDMQVITREEVNNKAKGLKERIAKSGSYKVINKLGILYARYGLYEDAEKQFKRLLTKSSYRDTGLINIGNIKYKTGDYKEALKYYNMAKKNNSDNPKLLINIARLNYQLGAYDRAQQLYEEAKIISPEIAGEYQYLEEKASTQKTNSTERATNVEEKGNVLWEE